MAIIRTTRQLPKSTITKALTMRLTGDSHRKLLLFRCQLEAQLGQPVTLTFAFNYLCSSLGV